MEGIILKDKELDRLVVIKQVESKELTQIEAADRLKLSSRQIRRLLKRVKEKGNEGIKPLARGGGRLFKAEFKQEVMSLIKEKYCDFGPTFASEKLADSDKKNVNRETLRQWMVEAGLWKGRSRKKARVHQSRDRRPCLGELVQIDGSYHDWFEGRGEKCCLLVFIDDATSQLLGLHFCPSETTLGYMHLVKEHLETHGRPVAYYSDKHAIFKTSPEKNTDRLVQDTQLHRALRTLGIELICAHSPQAKGRVERSNQTLQDRLIKEMRLKGICTIEEANGYAAEYIKKHNDKFAVKAADCDDKHRPVTQSKEALDQILSIQHERKISKNLEVFFENKIYQIKTETKGYRLRNKRVTVCTNSTGVTSILDGDKALEYTVLVRASSVKEVDTKELNGLLDEIVNRSFHPSEWLPTGHTAHDQP